MQCKVCGGDMRDARAEKGGNPKKPDFLCLTDGCVNEKGYQTGAWLPKGTRTGEFVRRGPNGATPPQGRPPTRVVSQAETDLFWHTKYQDYRKAFAITSKVIGESKMAGDAIGAASSAATGLCIALDRYRQQPPAEPLQPAVKAVQPAPKREPVKVAPKGLENDDPFKDEPQRDYADDDLPWEN